METNLFHPKTLDEGKETVVGSCNGFTAEERWQKETPVFAQRIADLIPAEGLVVLDYGCGVGRLAKAVLERNKKVSLIGLDASSEELALAKTYVNDSRFIPILPHQEFQEVDLAYSVYVLQHVPAVELREILQRIHFHLKAGGYFVYCSSDYRMAVRFDGQGFHDDRYLGVNIRQEISRYFDEVGDLFSLDTLVENPVVNKMVTGGADGLSHPAKLYRRKELSDYWTIPPAGDGTRESDKGTRRLILRNRLSPGDVLVMSAAVRSLKKAHPKYEIDIDSPTNEIYENSPYTTRLSGQGQVIDMQYPEIHQSGMSGRHFADGHRMYLEDVLKIEIPTTGLLPDIFLSQDEKLWPSPLLKELGEDGPYWVVDAGVKLDYPLKQWHRYQEVVDALKGKVRFVQIGLPEHDHKPLTDALDMRGKTRSHRDLFRLIYHAEGVLTPVSYPMHIAAAFGKPCVVIAGGREGARWEYYPNQRYLAMNGAISCAIYDGCWKSKLSDCCTPVDTDKGTVPLCQEMIRTEDVVRAIELYYVGGILRYADANVVG